MADDDSNLQIEVNPFFEDEEPVEIINRVISVLEMFRGVIVFNPTVLETIASHRSGPDGMYLILGSLTHALNKVRDTILQTSKAEEGSAT